MTKSESIIRTILGPVRVNIRPLTYAVDIAIDLLFVQNLSIDDIQLTRDIYAKVADQLGGKKTKSVSKSIRDLCNRCWNNGNEHLCKIIGRKLQNRCTPRDIIFYLAYYVYHDMPFYEAIQKGADLLY